MCNCAGRPSRQTLVWSSTLLMSCVYAEAAAAQSQQRISLETAAGIDEFAGNNAASKPQIIIDISASVRIPCLDRFHLHSIVR